MNNIEQVNNIIRHLEKAGECTAGPGGFIEIQAGIPFGLDHSSF
jgi:hypothetical protein